VTSKSPAIPPAGSGSAGVYLAVKGVRDIASGLFAATATAFTLPRLQHENELTGLGG